MYPNEASRFLKVEGTASWNNRVRQWAFAKSRPTASRYVASFSSCHQTPFLPSREGFRQSCPNQIGTFLNGCNLGNKHLRVHQRYTKSQAIIRVNHLIIPDCSALSKLVNRGIMNQTAPHVSLQTTEAGCGRRPRLHKDPAGDRFPENFEQSLQEAKRQFQYAMNMQYASSWSNSCPPQICTN